MSRSPRSTPCRRIREAMGISQRRLALHAGVGLTVIRHLERLDARAGSITLGDLVRVGDAFGVAAVVLVPGLVYWGENYGHVPGPAERLEGPESVESAGGCDGEADHGGELH